MSKVYLLLGSNTGDKKDFLWKAIDLIQEEIGNVVKASSIYETEPWGFECDEFFLNQVLEVKSNLLPDQLLNKLLAIEKKLGRKRELPIYQKRPIDIDILFFDDLIINSIDLNIPHPHLHLRKFALIPLNEIAGNFIHPVFHKDIRELTRICKDDKSIRIYEQYIHQTVNLMSVKA
ncbi:MAG: 2-amino-4-hydroxy-6-hydroxymethyldihydropteridine diphosphokinase [Bacteroidales bacterium]|nr:2-amino-4-hydroxy-6-hydroxymethyldihydropteridine diphosphokinase [Bacteroidales bacterium]